MLPAALYALTTKLEGKKVARRLKIWEIAKDFRRDSW
jgi:hypothetical protein